MILAGIDAGGVGPHLDFWLAGVEGIHGEVGCGVTNERRHRSRRGCPHAMGLIPHLGLPAVSPVHRADGIQVKAGGGLATKGTVGGGVADRVPVAIQGDLVPRRADADIAHPS